MGLTAATFSAKKQRGNWSADDVVKLMSIIENEDVEDCLMLELMRSAKNEEAISADDFRKEIKKWKWSLLGLFLKTSSPSQKMWYRL